MKDSVKRKGIFLFCKSQKSNIFFLQETHSEASDVPFRRNQWGHDMFFSHGSNRSAGVAVCFQKCPGKIIFHKADDDGHWLAIVLSLEKIFFILINVYGYNSRIQNKELLFVVTNIINDLKATYPTEFIQIGGDFNLTPDKWRDRHPSKYNAPQINEIIQNFCSSNQFSDIWRLQNPDTRQFSWIKPNANARSRIDYWLGTEAVSKYVCKCTISSAPLTDHCLIDLNLKPKEDSQFEGVLEI